MVRDNDESSHLREVMKPALCAGGDESASWRKPACRQAGGGLFCMRRCFIDINKWATIGMGSIVFFCRKVYLIYFSIYERNTILLLSLQPMGK